MADVAKSVDAFFEKIEKLKKPVKIAICVVLFLIPTGLFSWLSYYPSYEEIVKLEKDLGDLKDELEKTKREANRIDSVRKKIKEAEQAFESAKKELPESEEIPALLTNISRAGHDAGLEFMLFKPGPEKINKYYADIPVSIIVTGTYHEVANFFHKVSKLHRIVNVKDIALSSPAAKKGGKIKADTLKENELITSCTALTYKFVEPPPAPPPDDKKKTPPPPAPDEKKK
ncbi:MAG: hypothetical protein BWK80_29540 [Desulfobacteraceae bacterium IS3]|nr:MAG: hypothetical protein BWK80_29540 [Desulfobacteraceae bacterium IS3]